MKITPIQLSSAFHSTEQQGCSTLCARLEANKLSRNEDWGAHRKATVRHLQH